MSYRSRLFLRRFSLAFGFLSLLGLAAFYVSQTFRENLVFFATPTELLTQSSIGGGAEKVSLKKRLGGLVKKGSIIVQNEKKRDIMFTVTDMKSDIVVRYKGFLPDLFREGQGVVAEGTFDEVTKVFTAIKILAKHDENYRPPEVKRSLRGSVLPKTVVDEK